MPLLFSYGTLQREAVQLATFGRRLSGQPDALPGFAPARVPIRDPQTVAATGATHYDNAVFDGDARSRIAGMVFEVTDAELDEADRYERRARYVRIAAQLASGKRAWVYVDAGSAPAATD